MVKSGRAVVLERTKRGKGGTPEDIPFSMLLLEPFNISGVCQYRRLGFGVDGGTYSFWGYGDVSDHQR